MGVQERGLPGKLVGAMIRRSIRHRFHSVYWRPPHTPLVAPVVFACTHHNWHDGYLMFHAVDRLGIRCLDWIAEYYAFTPFRFVGGMPFTPGDMAERTKTIRETIRRMNKNDESLVLFADGNLRSAGQPWHVGEALDLVLKRVPDVTVVPVGITTVMGIHERPLAGVWMGEPLTLGPNLRSRAKQMCDILAAEAERGLTREPIEAALLARGTLDVNERWDMRRRAGKF
ncbi:MAG: hypothetical protein KF812_10330 [Fimbriimonadaceae bacterium]|nr:hypothetical protein [Fimbriimonadaceae bacterium]